MYVQYFSGSHGEQMAEHCSVVPRCPWGELWIQALDNRPGGLGWNPKAGGWKAHLLLLGELGFILAHQYYLHHHHPSHSYYDHHLKRHQLGQWWVKWNWGEVIEVNSCALMEISGSRIRNRITLTYKKNIKYKRKILMEILYEIHKEWKYEKERTSEDKMKERPKANHQTNMRDFQPSCVLIFFEEEGKDFLLLGNTFCERMIVVSTFACKEFLFMASYKISSPWACLIYNFI